MAVTKKPVVQELNAEMDVTNEEEDQVRTVSFEEFEMLRGQVAALTEQLQRHKIPQPNQHALHGSGASNREEPKPIVQQQRRRLERQQQEAPFMDHQREFEPR
jgi:phage I-like protein|uniref:Uncharacterized protein n=1 Tax=Fagus sylvatica TaxID=28930 RepID=A0A2N9FFV6_FAGSY